MDPAVRKAQGEFLQAVDSIRVHRDSEGRPSLKKPLLLLLLLSRFHKGELPENRIHYSDIESELTELIKRFGLRGGKGSASPEEPFVYLGTASFWNLHYPEATPTDRRTRRSKKVLREPRTHVTLKDEVYAMLKDREALDEVVRYLLDQWWEEEERKELRAALGL